MQTVSCQHDVFGLVGFLKSEGLAYNSALTDVIPIKSMTTRAGDGEFPSLFVPLKGEKDDGHNYIADHLRAHPDNIALCGNFFKDEISEPYRSRVIFVADPLLALQAMAAAYRKTFQCDVIGVTGSNGKTTFKEILAMTLGMTCRVHATVLNLNNHIGVPLSILAAPKDAALLIFEMGMNHAGEISTLCKICDPTVGVVTNIGPAHIQFFGSLRKIAAAKAELFDYVSEHNGVNFSPERYAQVFDAKYKESIRWVPADFVYDDVHVDDHGNVKLDGIQYSLLEIGIPVETHALFLALIHHFKVPEDIYLRSIKKFMEKDKGLRGALYYSGPHTVFLDCYNANPESFIYSLKRALYFATRSQADMFVGWYADMRELGKHAAAYHEQVFEAIIQTQFSIEKVKLFFFGPEFKKAAKEEMRALKQIDVAPDRDLKMEIVTNASTQDAADILDAVMENIGSNFFHVKGSRFFELEKVFEKRLPRTGALD